MLARRDSKHRLMAFPSFVMLAFAAAVVSPGVVEAVPEIEIAVVGTSTPATWLEDRTFDVTVSNPGTEPLSDVLVRGWDEVLVNEDFGDVVNGPTFVVGNSDDLLEPGEVWSYSTIAPTVPGWVYEVTATDPSDGTVTATGGVSVGDYPGALLFPIEIEVVPDSVGVAPGTTLGFTVSVTNTFSFGLDLAGEHRLLPPVRDGIIRNTPLGEPSESGNGDAVLDPDERWEWRIEHVVVESDWYVQLQLGIGRAGFVPSYGVFYDGPPVIVDAPTGTTTTTPATTQPPATDVATTAPVPSGQLPETGSTSTSAAWFAALSTIAGGLLVMISRRRPL